MRPVILRQQASDAVFVHWAVSPDVVRPLLPAGLVPAERDGATYVGLVAVRNERIHLGPVSAPTRLACYPQVNVRLYVRDRRGRAGVLFLSMEVPSRPAVVLGRGVLGLPYRRLAVEHDRKDDVVTYRPRIAVRVTGEPVREDPAVPFITGADRLFCVRAGRLLCIENDHPPWPLVAAKLEFLAPPETVAVPLGSPSSVLFSPGVPMTLRLRGREHGGSLRRSVR